MTSTESTTERPLVTFALFAYNQEKYIREAVEGAFAQTYEPLEIILSDDCSMDRTFEIMKEMAREYRGPHRIRLISNPNNLGLLHHFFLRSREAKGRYIVVAAGDDISKCDRTYMAVDPLIKDASIYATVSRVRIIDSCGIIVNNNALQPTYMLPPKFYLLNQDVNNFIQGCSATYRKEIFHMCDYDTGLGLSEDFYLGFLMNILNLKIYRINETLVDYRVHENAISNRIIHKNTVERVEIAELEGARRTISRINSIVRIAKKYNCSYRLNCEEIDVDIDRANTIIGWSEKNITKRLFSICNDLISKKKYNIKWKIARIYGKVGSYQPKTFISKMQGCYK